MKTCIQIHLIFCKTELLKSKRALAFFTIFDGGGSFEVGLVFFFFFFGDVNPYEETY